jgi:hypothetical protein
VHKTLFLLVFIFVSYVTCWNWNMTHHLISGFQCLHMPSEFHPPASKCLIDSLCVAWQDHFRDLHFPVSYMAKIKHAWRATKMASLYYSGIPYAQFHADNCYIRPCISPSLWTNQHTQDGFRTHKRQQATLL